MKKLIALAIAALPVAAMADVTLYGKMAVEVNSGKNLGRGSFATNGDLQRVTGVDMSDTSRIGFKGSEDLGSGLKAIWQVEQGLSFDDNATGNRFATRDSFVGLEGGFGKVRLGRLSTYQNSDMEQVDPWMYAGSKGGVNGLGYFTRLDGRVNNAIRYDSPNISGFNATVLYGTDEARATVAGNETNKDLWNLGLGYSANGIFAHYSYLRQNDAGGTKGDQAASSHRVEAGYDANNIYVALGYQDTRGFGNYLGGAGFVGNDEVKTRELALTAAYTMGNITPRVSFVKGWDVKVGSTDVNNSGYKQFVIGADYALSKRTAAYASYGQVNWDSKVAGNDDKEHNLGVGIRHNF